MLRGMPSRDWVRRQIDAAAFEQLASGLSGSELQSVLLEIMQRRSQARTPAQVLGSYQRDAFCRPAPVDPRTTLTIDAQLFAAAHAFEAIELSPVTPLGTCTCVALTTQNRVLSALRGTEVVSDPTNVLALECAARWREQPATPIHLTTSQRVIRAQPVPNAPGYSHHFRIFILASGGIETQAHAFTIDSMVLHIRAMLDALDRLEQHGFTFGARRVDILATPERAQIGDRIAAELGPIATRDTLDHAYYSGGLRYKLWVTQPDGTQLPLIDGGTFDWLAKLTSNRRAVYIATGAGSQLIGVRFRAGT